MARRNRTLKLRPGYFLEHSDAENPNELALWSGCTRQSVSNLNDASTQRIDLDVLSAVLSEGLGRTEQQILDMRLGEFLEFVDRPPRKA